METKGSAISKLYVNGQHSTYRYQRLPWRHLLSDIDSHRKHQKSRFRLKRVHPDQSQTHHDASMTRSRTASRTQYSAIMTILESIPEVPRHPPAEPPEKLLEKRCQEFVKTNFTDFCRSKRLLHDDKT